jgi:hypothetical protein
VLALLACAPLLIRRWPLALAVTAAGWVAAFALVTVALHSGLFVAAAGPLATLLVAGLLPLVRPLKQLVRPVRNIQHSA